MELDSVRGQSSGPATRPMVALVSGWTVICFERCPRALLRPAQTSTETPTPLTSARSSVFARRFCLPVLPLKAKRCIVLRPVTSSPHPVDAPADRSPAPSGVPSEAVSFWRWLWCAVRTWTGAGVLRVEPRFKNVIWPALCIALLAFMRSPTSNYIFDEQEALLGNPYLNSPSIRFWEVFQRDFWGLPPDGTIGSYRPLPNILWRLLWAVAEQPWLLHWLNLVLHAVNAALLTDFVWRTTAERRFSWLTGATFLMCALLTEAVTGVVGLADVLAGTGVLLAMHALRLRWHWAIVGIIAGTLLGLGSKESALVLIPLLGWAALVLAPVFAPQRPLRLIRAFLALMASAIALVGYTYFRRSQFPTAIPADLNVQLSPDATIVERTLRAFLVWFRQPQLPHDPLNNPLLDADFPHRIAGALGVYARGLLQVVFPWRLSGDYSFAEERIPEHLVSFSSVAGALLLLAPPSMALVLWRRALLRERRVRRLGQRPTEDRELRSWALLALGFLWFPVAYFPHSNIPVLLPTIRAERLWYLPAMGTSMVIGYALWKLLDFGYLSRKHWPIRLVVGFLLVQFVQARIHALAYSSDLVFWRANVVAAPQSAKAQLNYAVMLGARGYMQERLAFNYRALQLAPQWPMASVYYADALCRMGRPERAWRHYERGFSSAPNQKSLISLGLQCLWDTGKIPEHSAELSAMATAHPGSWLAYLAIDIIDNGKQYAGVRPEHRPRGYDQKRVEDSATETEASVGAASASASVSLSAAGAAVGAGTAAATDAVSAWLSAVGAAAGAGTAAAAGAAGGDTSAGGAGDGYVL